MLKAPHMRDNSSAPGEIFILFLSLVESSNDSEITFCFPHIHVKHRTSDEARKENNDKEHDIRISHFSVFIFFRSKLEDISVSSQDRKIKLKKEKPWLKIYSKLGN